MEHQDLVNETINLVMQLMQDHKHQEAAQKIEQVALEVIQTEGNAARLKQRNIIKTMVVLETQIKKFEAELGEIAEYADEYDMRSFNKFLRELKQYHSKLLFQKKELARIR